MAAKINEFKKVKEQDAKPNNYIVAFMAGVLAVFMATGFNETVAVECCECFSFGLAAMILDGIVQAIKGNFNRIQKTERKEANKKEA